LAADSVSFRVYDPERDEKAAHRIWREIGWLEAGQEESMDLLVNAARAMVAEIQGEAECLVLSAPGGICYLDEELPFAGITGVTTSRIARRQGFASRLTARVVAADAATGAMVIGLGMFEQGFYNQLGFGTGSYEHWMGFDPARLRIRANARVPRRIGIEDWTEAHRARLRRRRAHGSLVFHPPAMTRSEMSFAKQGFGLGYYDGPDDALTHYLWCDAKGERGPYRVWWMAYQTWEQFLELMALLRNLGDQVRLVRMAEPPGIQLQDLIEQPFKQYQVSEKSPFAAEPRAIAWWQMRICDLSGCLAHTHLPGETVRFNLQLSDPIERFLDSDISWRGLGGDYVVTLGPTSLAERGQEKSLPILRASVGAFTRLWLGVQSASGLAVTDDLCGPPDLLQALDVALRLPVPRIDWDF
jgi:hypothetical protein